MNIEELVFFFLTVFFMLFVAPSAEPAEVIVVGEVGLKPVHDVISGIRETMRADFEVYSPKSVKGRLNKVVEKENSRLVIALGRESIDDALGLPPSIPVLYALVITPPIVNRNNMTGFYMATPVGKYVDIIRDYLPSLRRIAVPGSRETIKTMGAAYYPQVVPYYVKNSYEFVNALESLENVDAILLLPDPFVLTATAVEKVYLLSLKKGIPILGLSEKYVKQGALFALVFDSQETGRQIGKTASRIMAGEVDPGSIPPSPSPKFDLFINMDTARQMGIRVPSGLLKQAKEVYP